MKNKTIAVVGLVLTSLISIEASAFDGDGDGGADKAPKVEPIPIGEPGQQPTLEEDLIAVEFAMTEPEMQTFCFESADIAWDLYLSDAFLVGEEEIAAEMLVSWLVEMFEEGYESNLHWEAEKVLSDYLMACAGFPQP
jgi:hypothetical protein